MNYERERRRAGLKDSDKKWGNWEWQSESEIEQVREKKLQIDKSQWECMVESCDR